MKNLRKICEMELVEPPPITMDYFQTQILNNLHLEFFFEECRVLITPEGDVMPTGPHSDDEVTDLVELLAREKERIARLKRYLIFELSIYSSLLETNSYYITLNDHVVITRFVALPDEPEVFEVKLYTASREDLPQNYKDKIYIGRDFLNLTRPQRDHFGLRHMQRSIMEQVEKLRRRFHQLVPEEMRTELEDEYLNEIRELADDYRNSAESLLADLPARIDPDESTADELTLVNRRYRELKHLLLELEDSTHELEAVLFDLNQSRAVRYVTKFSKDLTNHINYIMFRVNGRITDTVNQIRL